MAVTYKDLQRPVANGSVTASLLRNQGAGCNGDGHESEWHVASLPVDGEIWNRGSLEGLRAIVEDLLLLRWANCGINRAVTASSV